MASLGLGTTAKQYTGFNPRMIGNCQLWLDANDINTFTLSGSSITTWADKSGNGRNATGYTGTGTYSSNGLNSLPTVQITTTGNMRCTIAANTFSNAVSCFIVFQKTGANNAIDNILSRTIGTSPNVIPAPFEIVSSNDFSGRRQMGGNSTTTNFTTYDVNDSLCRRQNPTLYYFSIASNATTTWNESINGVFSNYTNTALSGTASYSDAATALYIGANQIAGSGRMTGNISEIIMYNFVLSDLQRQEVEGYLAWKWNLINPALQFSPLSISPFCQVWMDAADSNSVTLVSGRVSQWNDKSGNGYNLSQTTAANRPTYTSGQFVNFSNSNAMTWLSTYNILNGGGGSQTSNYAIFMVFNPISSSNVFMQKGSGGNLFNVLSMGFYPNVGGGGAYIAASFTASNALLWTNNTSNLASSPPFYSTQGYTLNTPQIASYQMMTAAIGGFYGTFTSNGYVLPSLGGGIDLCNASSTITVGSPGTPASTLATNFNLHELIIFNTFLTDSQRQQVEGYLAWKWNLQGSFNPTLDYYSNAPTYAIVPASNSYYTNTMNANSFQPTFFPGCSLWLDSADPSTLTLTVTSNISRWRDKSSQQNDFIQNTAGNQPFYATDPNTGRLTVQFGSSRFMTQSNTSTKFAISTNRFWTTFVVHRFVTVTGTQNIYRKQGGTPVADQWIRLSAGNISFFVGVQESQLSYGPYTTALALLTHAVGGTNVNLTASTTSYIQGTQVANATVVPSAINSFAFSLGGNNASESHSGYIYEMIIYNNPLSIPQRQAVEGYLAWKWGIVSALPATHPYKTIQPLNIDAFALQSPIPSATPTLRLFDRLPNTALTVYNKYGNFLSRSRTAIPYACVCANSNGLLVGAGNYYATYTASNADDTAFATTLALLGGADVYIIRYYSNGAVSWVTRIGSTNNEFVTAMAPINTNLGDEFLVGGHAGGLSGGATSIGFYSQPGSTLTTSRTLAPAATDYMAWVTRYTSAGAVNLAMRMIGSASSGTLNAVSTFAVDTVDNSFYAIGTFTSLTFNIYNTGDTVTSSITNTNANGVLQPMMFIQKYSSAGSLTWTTKAELNWTGVVGAVVDNSQNLIVALNARTASPYNQPGTTGPAATITGNGGFNYGLLLRFNSAGTYLDSAYIGGSVGSGAWDYIRGIARDSTGNIYVIGTMTSATLQIRSRTNSLLTSLTRTSTSFSDAFIVEYNTDLTAVAWAKNITIGSSPYHTAFQSITIDTTQNVANVIGLTTAIQLYNENGLILTKRLSQKFVVPFLIQYDTNGNVLSAREIITTQVEGGSFNSISDGIGNTIFSMSLYDSWTCRYLGNSAPLFSSVGMSYDGRVIAATIAGGRILVSLDAGKTWTARESSRNWSSIAVAANGALMAACVNGGFIYTSTDSGTTWTQRAVSLNWVQISISDNGNLMICAPNPGQLYGSINSGVTWTTRSATSETWGACTIGGITQVGSYRAVAAVYGGQIWTSASTTGNLTVVAASPTANWNSLATMPSGGGGLSLTGVATTDGGQVYIGTASMATWTARDVNRSWKSCAISYSGSNVVAVASNDKIFVSENTGTTWNPKFDTGVWSGVAMSASGTRIVAVQNGDFPPIVANF